MEPRHDKTRARRLGGLLGLGVIAVLAGQLAWAVPASAALVTLPGCALTDDGGTPLDLSASIDTDDPTLDQFDDGDFVAFHDVFGPLEVGAPVGGDEMPPLCAAPIHRDGGQISFGTPTWLWCTELDDSVCGTGALEPKDTVLDDDQLALVGWVLQQFATSGELRQSRVYGIQNRIWCITDGYSAIDDDDAYGPYVDGDPSIETCLQYREWLTTTVLPGLPRSDDTVTLTGPDAPALVGTTQVFTLTSDVAHLTLSVTGPGEVVPCDDTATLDGDDLVVVPGQPTDLCATSGAAGEVDVAVSSLHEAGLSGQQYGYVDDSCQVFITSDLRVLRLEADAAATFVDQEQTTTTTSTTVAEETTTTSTTSTTIDSTTTTLDGGTTTTVDETTTALDGGDGSGGSSSRYETTGQLARTGGEARTLGIVGALLLLVGVAVLAARRRLVRSA